MKYSNFSIVFILIFSLFETITAITIPKECKVIEEVINTVGHDLQKTYKDLNIINCCDFPQITCQTFNNQAVVTEIKFNNYENLSYQDMKKIISQFAKLPYLTTLEMSNNLIVGEFPNNLSKLKKLQKVDLSGNCWEDRNINTNLNIEELNISDPCINKNKKVKDLGGNKFIKLYTFVMITSILIGNIEIGRRIYRLFNDNIEIGRRISRLLIDNMILYKVCHIIYVMVYTNFHIFVYNSIRVGIKKGKLDLMKKFKYYYIVVIFLQISGSNILRKLVEEKLKKSDKSKNETEKLKIPYRIIYHELCRLIIHIVYYILVINYTNKYEAYLKN